MVFAGVLLKIDAARAKEILNEIKDIEEVKNAFLVFGRYDMVVMLEAKSIEDIGRVVIEKIAKIPGIRSTETLIAATF